MIPQDTLELEEFLNITELAPKQTNKKILILTAYDHIYGKIFAKV